VISRREFVDRPDGTARGVPTFGAVVDDFAIIV
jgi:hypothetical protein